MKDDNVYFKKDNGRYEAFGICTTHEYLNDGIWYVKHHSHSKSTTSVPYIAGLFRVGDAKEIDIPTLCGLEDMCRKIEDSDEWKELIKNGSYCLDDIVHVCVKVMYNESLKENNN